MANGRNFEQTMLKAVRSLERGWEDVLQGKIGVT